MLRPGCATPARTDLFGSPDVPWPTAALDDATDRRLRLLVGDDAPTQAAFALALRLDDYALDPRCPAEAGASRNRA